MDPYEFAAPDRDTRRWAMMCHLGGLASLSSVPFAGILAPLIIWQAKRDEHPFIDDHGKEALNFQISMSIYYAVLLVAATILTFLVIGIFLWPFVGLVWLLQLIGAIVGGVRANEGGFYRFPGIIRFVA